LFSVCIKIIGGAQSTTTKLLSLQAYYATAGNLGAMALLDQKYDVVKNNKNWYTNPARNKKVLKMINVMKNGLVRFSSRSFSHGRNCS